MPALGSLRLKWVITHEKLINRTGIEIEQKVDELIILIIGLNIFTIIPIIWVWKYIEHDLYGRFFAGPTNFVKPYELL